MIYYHNWTRVTSGPESLSMWAFARYAPSNRSYFDFDFYHQCCGTLEIAGLRNITDVPYAYILTCTDADGNGGSSQPGSSSGGSGSSGSGGSSSGDGSSGGSGGDGSGGSSGGGGSSDDDGGGYDDGGPWESDGSFPWQDDDGIPEFDGSIPSVPYSNGGEDGEGEDGDTWTLPEWGVPGEPPFTDADANIPPFPVELSEGYPDFPGDMAEGYPDPYLPGYGWPPSMPQPGG